MAMDIKLLNNYHLDVLKEIGNIGAGNAATALAKMLNRKIWMDIPKVKVLEFKEVSKILGGEEVLVIGVYFSVVGDISGSILFILEYSAASELVKILMKNYIGVESKCDNFDEMENSALCEVGNILSGAYLSALSVLTNLKIIQSTPSLAVDMAGAILSVPAIEFGKIGDSVLYIETEFSEGATKVAGDFFLVPSIDSYAVLLKALGVI